MDEKLAYWGSLLLSAVALVLVVVNISLANGNRDLQRDLATRQATINAGQQLSQLNQGLAQALAEAAVKNNNLQARDLLATQGITLRNDAVAPAAKAEAPAPAAKK